MTPSVHVIEAEGEIATPAAAQRPIVVLKFGSSVLAGPDDMPEVVSEIYRIVRTGRSAVAVVSAFAGMTDHLLTECAAAGVGHDNVNAPAYIALGEETSAAALALACDRAGLSSVALKSAELGLLAEGAPFDATPLALSGGRLDAALALHDVVIVPGFVAIDRSGRTVLLGRGGSDLTAVFLGDRLGAERVRLIKDVDGVYETDPAERAGARRFARVEWARAREVAGRLIQPKAIDFAAARELTIEVGCLAASEATIIDGQGNIPALPRPRRRLRVALAGLGVVGGGVAQRLSLRTDRYEIVGALVRNLARRRDFDWSAVPMTLVDAKPFVRRQQLRALVPLADTTVYEMEQRGEFPKRFYLTPRCPVWDLGEVNAWLAARREKTGSVNPPHPDVRRRKTRPVRV